ncbi:MAG: DUF2177 family protein [Casimicrobiaceae bacterium]
MMRWVVTYLATLAAICVLDALWLGFVARDFYRGQIGALMLERPRWGAAGLFYAVYALATVFFAIAPAQDHGGWLRALMLGALLGLFCYATYDLTNLATLKGWSVAVAAADIAWGIAVTAAASMAGHAALRAMT